MSRASIFDLLHQRQQPPEPVEETTSARSDYDADRLRLLDGVALTASGFVGAGTVPEAQSPALSPALHGLDGFRLLVHRVADVMPVQEPRLGRFEAKASRLHELVQTIVIEALMMLEALPEETAFDVVLTAPLRSPEATAIVVEHLRAAILETQYASALGELHHSTQGGDPHTVLGVGDSGGMPYVLWISVDSLLNEEGVAALQHRRVMGRSSNSPGLYVGEAVVALLVQRLLPDDPVFDSGWRIEKDISNDHPARATRRDHAKRKALLELLSEAWPLPAANSGAAVGETQASNTPGDRVGANAAPAWIVIDAMGLPGRAVEIGSALIERWPEIDMIDDGISVDQFCGWPGEAVTALTLALAIAPLSPADSALVLSVEGETRSTAWSLRSCAAEVTQGGDHS
ncbi:hypothetical protein F0A16_03350 [Salinicola corii]|uniref:Uncharacterized protein n=1 Tax=Salinicola corii TaxID=2606937 RepID=A0A640WJR7_9GAMM|nr:hypothetical protein [Salinicola corii]KAA0020830.1 hypothetical protein F0A16_03350 [Salinicola corii]